MIGDSKKDYCDSGGLGLKIEKDPLQVGDMRNSTLYTLGESATEVNMQKCADGKHPFERIPPKGNKMPKQSYKSFDYQFAKYMYEKILNIMPLTPEPNFEKWANTIRLIREREQIPEKRIVEIFEWANQDDFWQINIRSPIKLRKQIPVLDAQMRKSNGNNKQGTQKLSDSERIRQKCAANVEEINRG